MSNLKIEGDVEGLNDHHLEFIKRVLEKEGFNDARVNVSGVGESGDNYVANVKRIIAEKNGEVFKMIAKVAPSMEQVRAMMKVEKMFLNESIMLTEVLPKYRQLEDEAGLSEEERYKYPICYGCLMEAPNEIILLEDLSEPGFIMLDRLKPLSVKATKLGLESLAKLHARSFVLKHLEPRTFDDIKNRLQNIWETLDGDELLFAFIKSTENQMVSLLDEDLKYQKAVKGSLVDLFNLTLKQREIDDQSKYSVIQHGDCWSNNVMFKLQDGEPEECCIIDYQASKNNIPVADVHQFIFNSTNHEMRSKHYYNWLDLYHDHLEKNLAKFGLKANLIYPRDRFDVDMKRYGRISFGLSVFSASFILRDNKDAAEMKNGMENNLPTQELLESSGIITVGTNTSALMRERIIDLVDSYLEFGYIKV